MNKVNLQVKECQCGQEQWIQATLELGKKLCESSWSWSSSIALPLIKVEAYQCPLAPNSVHTQKQAAQRQKTKDKTKPLLVLSAMVNLT